MSRLVLLDEDYSGRDLRSVDGTNGYALRCDFQGAQFGNITNATFIECDLRGSDLTDAIYPGVTFHDCQYAGVILPSIGEMVAEWRGKVPAFDHIFIAMLLYKMSERDMPDGVRATLLRRARQLVENPGFCFADFARTWAEETVEHRCAYLIGRAMAEHPRLRDAWRQHAVPIIKEILPDLPTGEP